MIIVLMGVSGSGKSTVGKILASQLNWSFVEADDFHPAANKEKMHAGLPLNDQDRQPWLDRLQHRIDDAWSRRENIVLACSALKDAYRDFLEEHHPEAVWYVYLHGSEDLIRQRLAQRKGHFMNPSLLHSQFETLEEPPPQDAVQIEISAPPETQAAEIRARLGV